MRQSLFVIVSIAFLGACSGRGWPASMEDQPSIEPQEYPRPAPVGSVPAGGIETVKDRDELETAQNPYKGDPKSQERGSRLYGIHCVPCHGEKGRADGVAAEKGLAVADLLDPATCEKTDGLIYGTITAGGIIMKPVRDGLSSRDRWDLVSYVRSMQSLGCPPQGGTR